MSIGVGGAEGAAYQRIRAESKKSDGTCQRCSVRRVPGKTLCQRHVDEGNKASREARHARIAAGLCRLCNEPQAEGKKQCIKHLEKGRVRLPQSLERQWTPRWLPVKRIKGHVETVVPVRSSWLVGVG